MVKEAILYDLFCDRGGPGWVQEEVVRTRVREGRRLVAAANVPGAQHRATGVKREIRSNERGKSVTRCCSKERREYFDARHLCCSASKERSTRTRGGPCEVFLLPQETDERASTWRASPFLSPS